MQMRRRYKYLLLGLALVGTLCACEGKEPPPTPTPTPTPAPTPSPTPEVETNVFRETFRVGPGEDSPLVTVTVCYGRDDGPNTVTVEREGETIQTFTDEGGGGGLPSLTVEDMNFDGCLDFRYHYEQTVYHGLEHCYLWDGAAEEFRLAPELDSLTDLSFHPETETVHTYDRATFYRQYDVLRWTDAGLSYRRRYYFCREFWPPARAWWYAYRIWDHDPTAPPLDASDDCWTQVAYWDPGMEDADPEGVEAEADRWLDPDYYGDPPAVPAHISPRLLDELTWRLNSGEDYHQQVRALLDPLNALLECDSGAFFQEYILPTGYEGMWAGITGWSVDLDNDGVRDVLMADDQGTGHYSRFYLLRGLGDEDYELVQSRPLNRADWWWCVNWEGARYLVTYRSDHWAHRTLGMDVYLFEDGRVKERAALNFETTGYTVTQRLAADDYEWLAQRFETDGPAIWDQFQRDGKQICGSGEHPATAEELAALEDANSWYDYYVYGTLHYLDGGESPLIYGKKAGGCTASGRALDCTDGELPDQDKLGDLPQMLWYEQNPDGGTTQVVVSCFGNGPVYFEAFRYDARLARVVLEPQREVRLHTWTQGVDIDFETADWESWAWEGNLE